MLRVNQDIKTVSELKQIPKEILAQARESQRPVVITVNGKASAVLLNVDLYERLRSTAHLATLLSRAEDDLLKGKTMEVHRFFRGEEEVDHE